MDDRSFASMLQRATEAPPPDVVARITARLGAAHHAPDSLIDAVDLRELEPDRPDERGEGTDRARRRRRLALVAAAVVAAAAIGVSVTAIGREDGSPADEPTPSVPSSTSVVPTTTDAPPTDPFTEELPPGRIAFAARTPQPEAGNTTIDVIDVGTGTVVGQVPFVPDPGERWIVESLWTSPDKSVVAMQAARRQVLTEEHRTWEIDPRSGAFTELRGATGEVAYSRDGRWLAYVADMAGCCTSGWGDTIVVRDRTTNEERRWTLDDDQLSDFTGVNGLAWSPDGECLAFSRGYYGYDTFVLDIASDASLSDAPLFLADVAVMQWVDEKTVVGQYFCCDEAELPEAVSVELSTGVRTPLVLPEDRLRPENDRSRLSRVAASVNGRRMAWFFASTPPQTLYFAEADGTVLATLVDYTAVAW